MSKITGRVIDYDNDNPIANVIINGVSKSGTIFASSTTESDGTFVMDHAGLDDPYAQVTFNIPGYVPQTMRPASANNVDVVLAKSGTLAGFTVTLKQNKGKAILFAVIGAVAVYLYIKYKNKIKL